MEGHRISMEDRSRMTVTQVTDVDAFDEAALWADLQEGGIEVTGEKLHIEKLDLQEGVLVVSGRIATLSYTDKAAPKGRRFLGKWAFK